MEGLYRAGSEAGAQTPPLLRASSPLKPKINRELTSKAVHQTGALQNYDLRRLPPIAHRDRAAVSRRHSRVYSGTAKCPNYGCRPQVRLDGSPAVFNARYRISASVLSLPPFCARSPCGQQTRFLCLFLNLDLVHHLSMACIRLCDTEGEVALHFRIHRPRKRH